jgi:hypothetical protein
MTSWVHRAGRLGLALSLTSTLNISAQEPDGLLPPIVYQGNNSSTPAPERDAGAALNVSKVKSIGYLAQTSQSGQMSSKPPEFTIPPSTGFATPKAKSETPAAATDPAPAKTEAAASEKADNAGAQTFSGHPDVQNAFDRLATGTYKNTKYKWYGFVRLDGIYDLKPIRSTDMFVTSAIPIPQGEGQNAVLTPRYTRLGFDTETKMDCPDWTIKTRIEVDFFNGNTSGLFGSFPLRLRFAWAEFGNWRIGQDASLFMDYDVFPNVLDYEGPSGMVLMRQPVVSYRIPIYESIKVAVGVEQPYSDIEWFENGGFVVNSGTGIITDPTRARNVQDMFDLTANIKWDHDYGHWKVAGIGRKLTYQPVGANALDEFGYGVNLTGTFHPWAALRGCPKGREDEDMLQKCRFLGQYACGRGINRYIQDVNGLGLDAIFDPINGFEALDAYGWVFAYEHWLSKKWIANFTVSDTRTDLPDTLPGNTYQQAVYAAATLIWLPVERMGVGWELLYGSRENKDGAKGEAYRIQTGFQYRF